MPTRHEQWGLSPFKVVVEQITVQYYTSVSQGTLVFSDIDELVKWNDANKEAAKLDEERRDAALAKREQDRAAKILAEAEVTV